MDVNVLNYFEDSDKGPARVTIDIDKEAKQFLIELGFVSALKRGLDNFEDSLKTKTDV